MHATAGGADSRGEPLLERGLTVFIGELDFPLAVRVLSADRRQSVANCVQIRVGQQFLGIEHLGVRDRSAHVVFDQAFIERVVVARGVREHPLVEIDAFVPEPAHECSICLPAARPVKAR